VFAKSSTIKQRYTANFDFLSKVSAMRKRETKAGKMKKKKLQRALARERAAFVSNTAERELEAEAAAAEAAAELAALGLPPEREKEPAAEKDTNTVSQKADSSKAGLGETSRKKRTNTVSQKADSSKDKKTNTVGKKADSSKNTNTVGKKADSSKATAGLGETSPLPARE
jgi:hypothetical protein